MLNFQILISQIAGPVVILCLMIALSAVLLFFGLKKYFYNIFFSAFLAMLITYSLKNLFQVPRPIDMLVVEAGYRFPSGHATMASVVSVLIIYFANKTIKNRYLRILAYIFAIFWTLLVSYSRIYLNVHYLVDVIVGVGIGICATLVVIAVCKRYNKS